MKPLQKTAPTHLTSHLKASRILADSPGLPGRHFMVDPQIFTRSSSESFRAVADATYDWESLLDMQGKLLWVNPAVERLTGYAVVECLNWSRYPLEIIAPEDAEMFAALMLSAKEGSTGNDVEFQVDCKAGTRKWFAVSWQPLRDATGTPTGIRLSKRDISDRKAIEAKLRKQSQQLEELAEARARQIVELEQRRLHMQKLAALGNMAAALAHEINNPLAGIKNALRLIQGREQLKAGSVELLELVEKEITRIVGLIRQMQQLCRPTISTPQLVNVNRVVDEVIALVHAQYSVKRINFRKVHWPDELVGCMREPEVKQILHNLLLNASEASPIDATIEIMIEVVEPWLEIEITDHGQGIPDEILPKLFEPFSTSRYKTGQSGLGLGLSISNSLADALGGSLQARSVSGAGSSFILRLPFSAQS